MGSKAESRVPILLGTRRLSSSCLICNDVVFNKGSDFGTVSLTNVNAVCEMRQLPQLMGLELGSNEALITFCTKCGGQVQTYQLILDQVNGLMSQMNRIRQEVTQQLIDSGSKEAPTYIRNTRNLLSSQLLGVSVNAAPIQPDGQDIEMPPVYESIPENETPEIILDEDEDSTNNDACYSNTLGESDNGAVYSASSTVDPDSYEDYQYNREENGIDIIDLTDDAEEEPTQPWYSESGALFECNKRFCTSSFDTKAKLLKHSLSHCPKYFKCLSCPKVCKAIHHLENHIRQKHPKELQPHCTVPHTLVECTINCPYPDCNEGFFHRARLENHILDKHPNQVLSPPHQITLRPRPKAVKLVNCTFEGCELKFETRYLMYRHKRSGH